MTPRNSNTASRAGDIAFMLAAMRGVRPQTLVSVACECLRTSLRSPDNPTALRCLFTAEQWARGEATAHELNDAGSAAAGDAAAAQIEAVSGSKDAGEILKAKATYADCAAAHAIARSAEDTGRFLASRVIATGVLRGERAAAIVRKHLPSLP